MATNLYLDENVRNYRGFKNGDNISLNDMRVQMDKGRLYLVWDEDSPIPANIKDYVLEISCRVVIPQKPYRESGVYRHGSAKCELTTADHGSITREKLMYNLRITGKKMEDVQTLIHMVKTGAIRPRPEDSYEARQTGKSQADLERELTETQQRLGDALETLERVRNLLAQTEKTLANYRESDLLANRKSARLRRLAESLTQRSQWPWASKSTVARVIYAILDATK